MLDIILDIKMKKLILMVMILPLIFGCTQKINYDEVDEIECCEPHAIIYLQPYGNFSKEEVIKLLPVLKQHFELNYGFWHFEIKNPINLPIEGKVGKKYKASSILNSERKLLKGNEIIIGLTHEDICADIHNIKNYGIVGLSFLKRQVCVVSDKRLHDKTNLWKPILHEFMHTFYGSRHCPNDDPKCIMKDAKGHGNFSIQEYLCKDCIKE